ncbi:MAG: BTAD domain-containing putative transcriptional regulator [Desulfobacteraceae bacterium]|nr:BTAD domain-containing putative transcriptional regulator [Desulfobacteraceae bacterium]
MHRKPVPAKLLPPQIRTPLMRKRLLRQMNGAMDRKLTIVQGRAAQGKTTLAASYVAQSRVPFVWLNLGPEDADPAGLFHLLVHGLGPYLPEEALPHLMAYPSLSFGPREAMPLYREWSNAIFDRVVGPLRIVFDGADQMPSDAPSWQLLQAMVEALPQSVHLLMLSRQPPPIDYGCGAPSPQVQILGDSDLAFSIVETKAFLCRHCGFELSQEVLRKVHQITEGWIGGVILFSQAFKDKPGGRRPPMVDDAIPLASFQTAVNRYLDETIFSALRPEVQDFLLKASILDEFDQRLLAHLFPEIDGVQVLQNLVDRHLFVETYTHVAGSPTFRFHNLFRDFLSYKRSTVMAEPEIRRLFAEAARFFQTQERHEAAARFYLKARAYPEAVASIEHFGGQLVKEGRHALLGKMLAVLPEEVMADRPWLLLFAAITTRFTEAERNISRLWRAYEMFGAQDRIDGRMLCLAFLLEATLMRGRDVVPLSDLLEQTKALAQAPGADGLDREKALLWLNAGLALSIRGGDPRKGYAACRNAWLFAAKAGDSILEFNALINACPALTWLGEFQILNGLLRNIDALEKRIEYPELFLMKEKALSEMHLFHGDLEAARVCLEKLDRAITESGLVYMVPLKLYSDFLLAHFSESHAEAQNVADQLFQLCSAMDHRTGLALSLILKGVSFYWQGNFAPAKHHFQESLAIYAEPGCSSSLHEHWGQLLTALVEIHLGQTETAESRTRSALAYFNRLQSNTFIIESLLVLAFGAIRQNRMPEAGDCLDEAFDRAQRHGIFHFAIVRPDDVMELCISALEMNLEDRFDYIQALLTGKFGPRGPEALAQLVDRGPPWARRKALEMLMAIRVQSAPRIVIRTLGDFEVLRGQTPVGEGDWKGSRSKDFLKALVARGGRNVAKERLIEDLWPESSALGEGTFKASLHRLRRVMEPDLDAMLGSVYILLGDNLLSLNPDLVEVDAFRFMDLYNTARKAEKEGRLDDALKGYLEADEWYNGDFLPGDRYVEWAEPMRRRLCDAYRDLLARVGELYEQRGALRKACRCYRRLLEIDPLAEDTGRKLMTLFVRRGMPNKALQVYEALRRRLKEDLCEEPGPGLEVVYQSILTSKNRT